MTARHCPHLHCRPEPPARSLLEVAELTGCTAACAGPLHGREVLRRRGALGGLRMLCGPRGRPVLAVIALVVGGTGVGRGQ